MNAVTAGFCRYGTYSMRHRLHRSVLYGGIDTVDSGVLIFVHRNDQTFLPVDDLGVNLSDFSGLDAQDDIVGLDGRDIFAIGISPPRPERSASPRAVALSFPPALPAPAFLCAFRWLPQASDQLTVRLPEVPRQIHFHRCSQ